VDASELPRVSKADVILMLNHRQSFTSTFDIIVHELGHVLLGHLGAMRGSREGRLALNPNRPASKEIHEFEALSVGTIVATVMGGFSPEISRMLHPFYKKLKDQELLDEVDVLEVFIAAEVLCAWCAKPPGRDAVPGGSRRGPPPGTLSGQR
jgi:hypothetical protein